MNDMSSHPDQSSRRDYLRLELGVIARLETLDGRRKVEIRDLSQGGARVKLLDEGEPFDKGVLCWLGFDTYAVVGRRIGNELGLVFDVPLRPVVIKKTREMAPRIWRNDSCYLGAMARDFVNGTFNT